MDAFASGSSSTRSGHGQRSGAHSIRMERKGCGHEFSSVDFLHEGVKRFEGICDRVDQAL